MGEQVGRNGKSKTGVKKDGSDKKNYRKLLAVAATPAIIASAFAPIAPISASADDVTSGTYTGEGYNAKWAVVDGGVRLYEFNVTLSGATTITIPESVNGQPVVSFDNKSLEQVSAAAFYAKTGTTASDYLASVHVPHLTTALEFTGAPHAFTSAQYQDGVAYKHTDANGINWTKQFRGDTSFSKREGYAVSSDNTANPLTFETFTVPDNVFGPVTHIGQFKGLDIGVAKLPDSVEVMRYNLPFGTNTTVRELDISNLKNVRHAASMLATMKGTNTKVVLGQSFLTARANDMSVGESSPIVFDSNLPLKTLEFSGDVTSIESRLFKGSLKLTVDNVVIPEGVTKIGDGAFAELKVNNPIVLPSTLKQIGDSAFEASKWAFPLDIVIPSGVTTIGQYAFRNSAPVGSAPFAFGGYNSIVVPKSVTSVGTDAFFGAGFDKVTVLNKYMKYPTNNRPFFLSQDGLIYGYIGSTTETVYGANGFIPLDGLAEEPTIATNLVNGKTYDGGITPTFTIEHADDVTYTLNGQPYDGTSPIATAGNHVLKVVAKNDFLSTTKTYTFEVAEAQNVYKGEGYTAKWEQVDGGVRLYEFNVTLSGATKITIPESVNGQPVVLVDNQSLEEHSSVGIFKNTRVKNAPDYLMIVNMPNIDIAFESDAIPHPNTMQNEGDAGNGVIYRATDEQGIIWEKQHKAKTMGRHDVGYTVSANAMTDLTFDTLTVPDNVFGPVTRIGKISRLTIGTLKLPDTVESFVEEAPFAGTSKTWVNTLDLSNLKNVKMAPLTLVDMQGDNPTLILSQSFLTAREQTVLDYGSSQPRKSIIGIYTTPSPIIKFSDDVTEVLSTLFDGLKTKVDLVELHEGITKIGDNVFKNVTINNTIELPSTLKHIGNSAFESSKGVMPGDLVLPDGLTHIGDNAFKNMVVSGDVNSLIVPKSVTSVGKDAFGNVSYNKVTVLNKYLRYPTNNRPFVLSPTGSIYGYLGSTTETVYNANGFVPIDGLEPTISTNLVDGTTYDGEVTPTFTIENADNVTYTLNGQPYDGKSPITASGENTLKVVAENAYLSASKTYTFTVAENQAPTVVGTIDNKTVTNGKVLTVDLKGLFNDPEGAALTYNVTTSDTRASEVWTNARGELKFQSQMTDTYDITVTATDGKNTSAPISFTVTVDDEVVVTPPVTEPPTPTAPTVEDKGQVPVQALEKTFSEVINVSMVGLNTEKEIQLGGLIDILNLENPKVTLSSTNDDVVSYDFNTDDRTIKLTNLREGFSNIQVVAESGGSKVVILLMVDSYGTANFGVNYIGDGQIYAGLEAYVVPVAEVFENVDLQNGDRFAVSVTKIPPNGAPTTPLPTETEVDTTSPDTAPVAFSRTAFASTSFDFLSPSTFRMAATTPVQQLSTPAGVPVETLYQEDGLVIKLVNGRLVVEGNEKSAYDISVKHEKADGSAPVEVAFKLDVLTKGMDSGNPTDGEDKPTDGGQPDGEDKPTDGGQPDGEDKPTDGGQPDGEDKPTDGGQPDGEDKPTDGGQPDGEDKPTDGGQPDGGDKPTDGGQPDGGDKPTDGGQPDGGDKPITGGGSVSTPPIDGTPIIEKPIIVDTGGGSGWTPPITGITPSIPTPAPDKPAVESILDDVDVEIEENEKGELIITVDDEDDVIGDNEGTITISNNGAHIVVGDVQKTINIDLGDYVFDGKRAIHLEDGHASTAMHYLKDDALVITTRHLDHVIITSRVSHPFKDLNPKWNNIGDIEDMYNYLITNGTTATTYDPTSNITRAQFAVMVARALELTVGDEPTSQTLTDVDGKWYAQEVQALVDTGIITGFTDGTFGGEKHLTRQQAAAIMTRMLTHLDMNVEPTKTMTFADEAKISDYAKDSVQYLAAQGILVNGKGVNFNPYADLTRDQMAKILVRALQLSDFY